MNKIIIIIPIAIYLIAMLYIAYRVNNIKNSSKNFTNEYYLGSRSMGGFVLAMTIVATYVGASSFIGGPGIAYNLGLGWVLLACIQVPTAFFTLGVLGKKLSIISRKLNAITIFDVLKARYNNNFLNVLSSILLIVFFISAIVAQFIGGARLFEAVTGLSYLTGLIIFSSVVIIYTTFGGFRAVTLTDAIQAVVMFTATVVLFIVILKNGNGMENIMMKIKDINPNLLRPDSGGNIAKPFIMSFWILVGIGVLGLPATTVRCMAFKDTKAMHNAMIIGTSLVGILVLGMHLVGVMGRAVIPDLQEVDKIIPILALKNLYPIKKISMWTSFLIGVLVFVLSIKPISLIAWVNLFAFGGQEIIFFCPLILGLYWKRANATGAIISIFSGIITYLTLEILKTKIYSLHNIVPGLIVAITFFIVGSYFGKKSDEKTIKIFFEY